ncbi:MAG: asparagine synthase (glutamine-hydrolyzing) [Gemmatimonadaceae bacterium]|nr:asparagine synthase (glutamine-hydrolyzing) [Gemmatimonadaceae bacterium]
MCGIVGTIALQGIVDSALLQQQRDTMRHRGPDSDGMWVSDDKRVGFGHRRLAIIDLSPGGHQPMIDPATSTVITFNGEIFNYIALQDTLRALGHSFRTQSDTEVILAAYRQWGIDCLDRLDGQFAIALYDPRERSVWLARDRAGEKPLFYHRGSQRFSFASEAKALLHDASIPRRMSVQGLNEYLAYGYVPGEHTIFADIKRVLPGTVARIDLTRATVDARRYWSLPGRTIGPAHPETDAGWIDELHDLLRTAVRRQLVADVPVGVLLSGGVDSSLITAIAAEVSSSTVRTFTARFTDTPDFDEGPFARLVAAHVGTQHTELEIESANADLLTSLVAQFDDPVADSSMIPTYMVSREIRKHATVALGGDGGDELFGGYPRYPIQLRQEQLRTRLPGFIRRPVAAIGQALLPVGTPGRGTLAAIGSTAGMSLSNAARIFRSDERRGLSDALARLPASELEAPEARRAGFGTDRETLLQRATALDFSTYMVDDVLVKVDRASMLTSLEVRAPFLSRSIIEFAFGRLPDRLRATTRGRKLILRGLGAQLLPAELDLRRKKGFDIPVDRWMRGPWRPMLEAAAAETDSPFRPGVIRGLSDRLQRGSPMGERLFSLLLLQLWQRAYRVHDIVER